MTARDGNQMKTSALLKQHEASGAHIGARPESPEHAAALTFGDVPAEYAAAREETVLIDESDRSRLTVSGSEAARFLHRMLANDVHGIPSGAGNVNLLLTPKGKIRFAFDLMVQGDRIELACPPGIASPLRAALDTYLFTEDVTLEETTDDHAPVTLAGPGTARLVERVLGSRPPTEAHKEVALAEGVSLTCMPFAGIDGVRIDAGPGGVDALWGRLVEGGAQPAGIVVRDILRVETGTPLFGIDLDENIYPQEARLDSAFSLEKGCYVGQEVVAKIDTYGGLNKRLCALRIDDDDPVARGTRLLRVENGESRDVGVVTSWAYSFIHDTGLVLAYLKRRNQESGTRFELGERGGSATVAPFAG